MSVIYVYINSVVGGNRGTLGLSVHIVLLERHRYHWSKTTDSAGWFLVVGGGVDNNGRLPKGAYDLKRGPVSVWAYGGTDAILQADKEVLRQKTACHIHEKKRMAGL